MKKAEKRLNLDSEQIVVIINAVSDEGFNLSNTVEEWLTYPSAIKSQQNGIIVLSEYKEIAARRTIGH